MKPNKSLLSLFAITLVLFSFFQNCQKVKFQDAPIESASLSPEEPTGVLNKTEPHILPKTQSASAFVGEASEWVTQLTVV